MIGIDRYLLPEGDRPVLAWYIRHLHVPHGWRERFFPPAPAEHAGPTPAESERIEAAREACGAQRFLALRDYPQGERERFVLLLFERDGDRPVSVVKLRREGSGGRSLREEWEALRFLARLPEDVSRTVPRPLAFRRIGDVEALHASALPGRSPYVAIWQAWRPRRLAPAHLVPAARWLARFHTVAPGASHGDYWARNVLLEGCAISGVVDWEHFETTGPRERDLFFYPIAYGEGFPWSRGRRVSREEAFRRTLLEENAVSREVRRYFDAYSEATGFPRDRIRSLLLDHLESQGRAAEHGMLREARRSVLDPP